MDAPPLRVRQMIRAHAGTAFGTMLAAKLQHPAMETQKAANLRSDAEYDGFIALVKALGGGISDEEVLALKAKIGEGVPFFIQNELVSGVPGLLLWQRRFWEEAKREWQELERRRVLGVYATGTGKSAAIAIASYAGSRKRSLVIVPNELLLGAMRETLGAPPAPGSQVPDNVVLPALRKYNLIEADAPMPKVLVLPDLGNPRDTYVYEAGGYHPTSAARTMIDIILDHDIVLSTSQTLTRERRTITDANGDIVEQPEGRLTKMNAWITEHREPLFDLLIFDEAHRIYCRTWRSIKNKLGGGTGLERIQSIPQTNLLLVTATPFHEAGNLDVDQVRDAGPTTNPQITPYTLIGAREDGVVKGVSFLNIRTNPEGQTAESWSEICCEARWMLIFPFAIAASSSSKCRRMQQMRSLMRMIRCPTSQWQLTARLWWSQAITTQPKTQGRSRRK